MRQGSVVKDFVKDGGKQECDNNIRKVHLHNVKFIFIFL